MKRLILILLLLISSLSFAQGIGALYENVVLSKDAQGFTKPLTTATITVCKEPATGITNPCSPQAVIYSDASMATQQQNPFNVDSTGSFHFFVPPGQYRIQVTAGGTISTSSNISIGNPVTPFGQHKTVPYGGAITFDASTGGIFAVTLTGNVASTTIANSVAGAAIGFEICQDAVGGRTFAWPASFIDTPTVTATASACTTSFFFYDGLNWRGIGGASGGGGGVASPLVVATGNTGLPAAITNAGLYMAGGFGGTTTGKLYIGDGGGLSFFMTKRTGATDTNLIQFKDDGTISTLGAGNGFWDFASTAAGAIGAAGKVRYTACTNAACVSENGSAIGYVPNTRTMNTTAVTVSNTATESSLMTYPIVASEWDPAGRAFLVRGGGFFSTTGTPTLLFKLSITGVTTLGNSITFTTPTGAVQNAWRFQCDLIRISAGAAGTMQAHCVFSINGNTVGTAVTENIASTGAGNTVDFTTGQTLAVRTQWGVASASNTITQKYMTIQKQFN